MICILHGYLLEGSGSNLWTRAVVRALCQEGETVHLLCQENHPELYDFIAEAYLYEPDGAVTTLLERSSPYAGKCVMHKPRLGETLPVYVWDKYEEFDHVVPMVELDQEVIDDYLDRNVAVLERVVAEHDIEAIHANHTVLSSVVAQRVKEARGVPYVIMPHGSAIEYAVKRDERFHTYGQDAVDQAGGLFVIGEEMRSRLVDVFPSLTGLSEKMTDLNLGVDTSLFDLVPRAERGRSIDRLGESLAELERGKTDDQSAAFTAALAEGLDKEALAAAIKTASAYVSKRTDHGVEARLADVDWSDDPVILFVGRIIASKGLHSIIMTLPEVLAEHPRARLVVVGHGPLREAMEALVWALSQGDLDLVRSIASWGGELEDTGHGPLAEAEAYLAAHEGAGTLESYMAKAKAHVSPRSVIFTGYLTHTELRHLFPCADVAIFPSVVAEAGPLVFLEALAAGCFPLGTYKAGMAASIDSVASEIPDAAEVMKLRPEAEHTVADMVVQANKALALAGVHREALRKIAVDKYEWRSVASRLRAALQSL